MARYLSASFCECQTACCIHPWDLEDIGERAECAGDLRRNVYLPSLKKPAAFFLVRWDCESVLFLKLDYEIILGGLYEEVCL